MAAERGERPIEELGTAECWGLLESVSLGRLAVTGLDGAPDVFPLNYTVHNGSLYARSAHGAKVLDIAIRPAAALEIDGEDDASHWSVVVRGAAARVEHDAEIRDSGVLRLDSANPASKPHVIRLTPSTVTGRRFRKGTHNAPQSAAATAEREVAEAPAPDEKRSPPRRGDRPTPIPHFAPDKDDSPNA
ncbi:pyridoxamine 5'-phosphate oxidase family protein [Microbacterium sp. DT81.1]|uniref:pyridoxamine 5'-phosphate oxidase family protein n=1 Tax=Microbacterium sp. DT81.1 TaxID=3393413 RepID=UPI003CF93336